MSNNHVESSVIVSAKEYYKDFILSDLPSGVVVDFSSVRSELDYENQTVTSVYDVAMPDTSKRYVELSISSKVDNMTPSDTINVEVNSFLKDFKSTVTGEFSKAHLEDSVNVVRDKLNVILHQISLSYEALEVYVDVIVNFIKEKLVSGLLEDGTLKDVGMWDRSSNIRDSKLAYCSVLYYDKPDYIVTMVLTVPFIDVINGDLTNSSIKYNLTFSHEEGYTTNHAVFSGKLSDTRESIVNSIRRFIQMQERE